jgi:hypothetical protein
MRIRYGMMTLIAATVSGAIAHPAVAGATKFGFRPITVQGSAQVDARALNNSDVIVGNFTTTGLPQGFILHGKALTVLPLPCGTCAVLPTAVNASGLVAGWIPGESVIFQFNGTAYVPGAMQVFGSGGSSTPGPELNNKGFEYFDGNIGSFPQIYAGTQPHVVPITQLNGGGDFFANSVNNRNMIAGTFFGGPHSGTPSVFKALAGAYVEVSPPGATAAWGGYINDLSNVAGSYQDSSGALHGFVGKSGSFKTFEVSAAPAALSVQALNNQNRVVGTYVDAKKTAQGVFLYNGSTTTVFARYPVADTLHLALNDKGVMLISDRTASGSVSSSSVLCAGPGC